MRVKTWSIESGEIDVREELDAAVWKISKEDGKIDDDYDHIFSNPYDNVTFATEIAPGKAELIDPYGQNITWVTLMERLVPLLDVIPSHMIRQYAQHRHTHCNKIGESLPPYEVQP